MQTLSLQTKKIDSVPGLVPVLDVWRELSAGAPTGSPEWLLEWWETFSRPDDALFVLLVIKPDGELVGLAPLFLRNRKGRLALRLLGSGVACTNHTTWFCLPGWEERVGIEVARYLLGNRKSWQQLILESVDADALAVHATRNVLAKNGCLAHQRQINSCWKIVLPATWEEYLGMLSRSLRKQCRKLQRRYFDSGRVQVRHVEKKEDLARGFEVLLKLHGARWGNSRNPLGVFGDGRFRSFHEKVAAKLLSQGKLRLAWLECDGKPLAVEYQFVDSLSVYAYQAGVDLSMDDYSPGKLSMMASIQFAIARRCKYFDLLRGDEPYKANWRAVPAPCFDIRVWQKCPAGFGAWSFWHGYTLLARAAKRILPPSLIQGGLKRLKDMKSTLSFHGQGKS